MLRYIKVVIVKLIEELTKRRFFSSTHAFMPPQRERERARRENGGGGVNHPQARLTLISSTHLVLSDCARDSCAPRRPRRAQSSAPVPPPVAAPPLRGASAERGSAFPPPRPSPTFSASSSGGVRQGTRSSRTWRAADTHRIVNTADDRLPKAQSADSRRVGTDHDNRRYTAQSTTVSDHRATSSHQEIRVVSCLL